jgi:hypothetical protein
MSDGDTLWHGLVYLSGPLAVLVGLAIFEPSVNQLHWIPMLVIMPALFFLVIVWSLVAESLIGRIEEVGVEADR